MIHGMRIIESVEMVDVVGENWTSVRSPGRARRRRKKHRQNIKPLYAPKKEFLQMGNTIICHPVMAAKLRVAVVERQV